jgi:hypothetical protein
MKEPHERIPSLAGFKTTGVWGEWSGKICWKQNFFTQITVLFFKKYL